MSVIEDVQPQQLVTKLPTDIHFILRNKDLHDKFRNFLIDKIAIESLLFLDDVKIYERITKPEWKQRAGHSVIAKFVGPNAKYQINISEQQRSALLETDIFDETTFDQAKNTVTELLQDNFFYSFVQYLKNPPAEPRNTKLSIHECYPTEPYFNRERRSSAGDRRRTSRFSHRLSRSSASDESNPSETV
mmetsp:Transcript_6868/g.7897  ORF Transcript_6868/g.7897 Transcript_6868/m.7897 type:complete len:189 (+) Transcript_6868:244-810(+)|eukprot:CAMPEP_0184018538 /NCGR_PEP_ID=MMETSP0954-20121128/8206_1 /TAXON_ID=627963 /ORGANISM="Aplanochytrium sp, Strain PBS07" /LENGTH=188 /DNA_ID=CAMNT_0026300013 /DNA_START=334 /DNA_END=900 /DNA_ORIENTATION=-